MDFSHKKENLIELVRSLQLARSGEFPLCHSNGIEPLPESPVFKRSCLWWVGGQLICVKCTARWGSEQRGSVVVYLVQFTHTVHNGYLTAPACWEHALS